LRADAARRLCHSRACAQPARFNRSSFISGAKARRAQVHCSPCRRRQSAPAHGGRASGYNDLAVCYFSSPAKNDCVATNLHIVWDIGLIRSIFWDWGGYVHYLETDWLPAHNVPGLDAGTPVDWALEAHKAARDVGVAGVTMDAHLGADYLAAVRPTLDRQLALAGASPGANAERSLT
jgi:hypothetical protein